MILCYLDTNKKNISIEKQRQIVKAYIAEHPDVEIESFHENHNISTLYQSLTSKGNTIIVANIVCLGISLREIRDNIVKFTRNQSTIISILENYIFSPNNETLNLLKGFDCAISIRNSLSSIVTKNALAERKANGVTLGRKTRNKKRVLDDKIDEIIYRKKKGETNLHIAQGLGVTPTTLYALYKMHPEIKKQIDGDI